MVSIGWKAGILIRLFAAAINPIAQRLQSREVAINSWYIIPYHARGGH